MPLSCTRRNLDAVAARAPRPAVVDALEPRRMLAFAAHINFQPSNVPVPNGYRADTGAVYGLRRNGLKYGWSGDNRAAAVDRDSPNAPDQRYDTFNSFLGASGNANLNWQIALPNGSYLVHVVAGDPGSSTKTLIKLNAEN